MSTSNSKKNVIVKMQRLSAGLRQYLSGQLLNLAGKSIKAEDMAKQLDGYVAQLASNDATKNAWTAQLEVTRVLEDTLDPQITALEKYLQSLYGPSSSTLGNYGLTPQKARTRTVKEKGEAIDKGAATRVARHTLGPRQKAAIHGVVEPETSPPTTSSNPPSPPTSADAIKRNS
jgi:hypothetical protein